MVIAGESLRWSLLSEYLMLLLRGHRLRPARCEQVELVELREIEEG